MITPIRLDHFAIAADDTDALAAWYEKVLGLKIHIAAGPNPPQTQKVYMVGPPATGGLPTGHMVEIMPKNTTPRHTRNSHEPGLSHAAWCVQNFDESLQHLRDHNVKFLSDVIPAIGGGRIISFEDLEGNMTQIVERK